MLRRLCSLSCLALAACSPASRFVATEDLGGADLRVVLALPSSGERRIELYTADEPFLFDLKELFARDDAKLQVYVLGFNAADLGRAFPALAGKSAAELVGMHLASFGEVGPGLYAGPEPTAVLCTELTPSSGEDLAYSPGCEAQLQADSEAHFGFALPAQQACASGEGPLRIYSRTATATACALVRNAACEWTSATLCPHYSTLFGPGIPGATRLREVPPDVLLGDGTELCRRSHAPLSRGESLRFDCPAGAAAGVSVQEAPLLPDGTHWRMEKIGNAATSPGAVMVSGPTGAIYAVRGASYIEFYRVAFGSDEVFASNLVAGTNAHRLVLAATGMGTLRRMSQNADARQLVLDAQGGAAVMIKDDSIDLPSAMQPLGYSEAMPVPVDLLRDRMGSVIAGPSASFYLPVLNGLRALRVQGSLVTLAAETPAAANIRYGPDAQIAAVRQGTNDRVLVWNGAGNLAMFGSDAQPLTSGCAITGRIVAAVDGPRLLRVPQGGSHVLEVLEIREGPPESCVAGIEHIYVPPNRSDATGVDFQVDLGWVVTIGGRRLVGYRYDSDGGVLDLETGLSQAVTLSAVSPIGALFGDQASTTIYGVFATRTSATFDVVRAPLLP